MNIKELKSKIVSEIADLDKVSKLNPSLPSEELAVEARANQKAIGILNKILSYLELDIDPKEIEENKEKDSFNM